MVLDLWEGRTGRHNRVSNHEYTSEARLLRDPRRGSPIHLLSDLLVDPASEESSEHNTIPISPAHPFLPKVGDGNDSQTSRLPQHRTRTRNPNRHTKRIRQAHNQLYDLMAKQRRERQNDENSGRDQPAPRFALFEPVGQGADPALEIVFVDFEEDREDDCYYGEGDDPEAVLAFLHSAV